MIQEVIFDCFGVLTQDGWTTLLKKYATNETEEELHSLNHRVDAGLITFDNFVGQVSKISGATKADIMNILVNNYHPEMEIFELIAELKKNYKIGLISNISDTIEHYLPTAPTDLFDEQTLSYRVGVPKPSQEIFKIHLERTGVAADQAVFIDDRESNCEGARAVGLHAIHFKHLEQLKGDLKKLGIKIA